MAKKNLWDGAKIMMMVARKAKKNYRPQLYTQRVSHEVFGEIVYICDGCCVFPIEAEVFDANAKKYNYPTTDSSQDLYKIVRDAFDDGIKACYTPIHFNNSVTLTTRIVRYNKGYSMLDDKYVDLVSYLPTALQNGGNLRGNDKKPFANYADSCDLGYCILPIYNVHGSDNVFEKTITDLSCVCDW